MPRNEKLYTKDEVLQLIMSCIEYSAQDRRNRRKHYLSDLLGWPYEECVELLEELEFVDAHLCKDVIEHVLVEHQQKEGLFLFAFRTGLLT